MFRPVGLEHQVVVQLFDRSTFIAGDAVFWTLYWEGKDISSFESLKDTAIPVLPKKLLLNMDSLGIFIDNIEGVTFGPLLANGKQSLIFIADNNFNFFEKSQLLLFELSK